MMMKIPIKGDIVDDASAAFYDFFGIPSTSPSKINNLINSADGDALEVDIASNGGDVSAASEIYTNLKGYQGKVTVNVEGLAASSASIIAMAGDEVNVSPTAQMMIHKAWTITQGNADDLSKAVDMMDVTDQSIVNAYELKTGMKRDDILQMMAKSTWMSAQDAVDKGFADKILFVDEKTPQVVNATSTVVPKTAVNKLLTLLNQKGVSNKALKPVSKNDNQKPTPSLRDQKLAILFGKDDDQNGN